MRFAMATKSSKSRYRFPGQLNTDKKLQSTRGETYPGKIISAKHEQETAVEGEEEEEAIIQRKDEEKERLTL